MLSARYARSFDDLACATAINNLGQQKCIQVKYIHTYIVGIHRQTRKPGKAAGASGSACIALPSCDCSSTIILSIQGPCCGQNNKAIFWTIIDESPMGIDTLI